jgi:hypothetical protein
MADAIPTWAVQQFSTNVQHKIQARGGRLRGAVSVGTYKGKQASPVNYLGDTDPVETVERYGNTPNMEIDHERRWIRPRKFHWGKLVETDDELFTGIMPQGAYVEAATKGFGRKEDLVILSSFFATAYTGEIGETAEAWTDTGYLVGDDVGGSNTGLNIAKLAAVIETFGGLDVDLEDDEVHMVVTQKEWADLMAISTIQSQDFFDGRPLQTAKLPALFNITFHIFSTATLDKVADLAVDTNIRSLPVWLKSGMHLGIWQDRQTEIARNPEKQFKPQIYISQFYGAARLELGKVLKVDVYRA